MSEDEILSGLLGDLRYSAACQVESGLLERNDKRSYDDVIRDWASGKEYSSDAVKIRVAKLLVLKGKL